MINITFDNDYHYYLVLILDISLFNKEYEAHESICPQIFPANR